MRRRAQRPRLVTRQPSTYSKASRATAILRDIVIRWEAGAQHACRGHKADPPGAVCTAVSAAADIATADNAAALSVETPAANMAAKGD